MEKIADQLYQRCIRGQGFNVVDSLAQGLWCAYQDRTHNSTLNFGSHLDLDPNLGIFSMNFFHTLS